MVTTVIATGMVTRDDVETAAARTRNVVRHTPLTLVEPGVFPGTVMLKLEQLQHTGGYPVRGIFNQVIAGLERQAFDPGAGLVTAYTPAVAAAAKHVAKHLGLPLTVTESQIEAQRYAMTTGALHCAGLGSECWAYMVAGVGTIGLELWTQTLGQLDTVIVPARATALAAGVASALAGHVRVVEAACPADLCSTARRQLWQERRIAVDDVAASAYAYLTSGPGDLGRVAVVLSSADTVPSVVPAPASPALSAVSV
jgi:threonine dehydratase